MPKFTYGKQSEFNLIDVHPKLVRHFRYALSLGVYDIVIIDGIRTLKEQEYNVLKRVSKTMNSKHLRQVSGYSEAIDSLPWPDFDWNAPGADRDLIMYLAWHQGVADGQKLIKLRTGNDWNMNNKNSDNKFQDLDHAEILLNA